LYNDEQQFATIILSNATIKQRIKQNSILLVVLVYRAENTG